MKLFFRSTLTYLLNNLIALDQLVNTLLLGSPDETLSSRAFRSEQSNKIFGKIFRPLIDALFYLIEKDHCYKAFLSEVNKLQLPKSYRG